MNQKHPINNAPVAIRDAPNTVPVGGEPAAHTDFHSILFERPDDFLPEDANRAPDFFIDLNCDQIVEHVTAGKEEYDLKPLFYACLRRVEAIEYRHGVMRDLDDARILAALQTFAASMRCVRDNLAQLDKHYHEYQKTWWLLDAVDLFASAVDGLLRVLSTAILGSRGLRAFRDYLAGYASSDSFTSSAAEAKRLKAALSAVRYSVLIRGPRVEVFPSAGASDYSREVEKTFARFQQGSSRTYEFRFSDSLEMNHVEAQILEGVARLHAKLFSQIAAYRARADGFLDPVVARFDREIQFYLAYREYIGRLQQAGLSFCYPLVQAAHKDIYGYESFDLALADKLMRKSAIPVCNDFRLNDRERIIVVSGPNQGGKTTFARTFGQLHYLANLGLPVPGTRARLRLFDRIFVHFEREERVSSLRGKLEDDLARIRGIVARATPHSIVIINEIFASTSLRDAVFLSKKIATAIVELDALCVWVTFLDELASLGGKVVSMVSTVVPENPAQRTFKIVRRPADGLAYAMALAERHGLSYKIISRRISS